MTAIERTAYPRLKRSHFRQKDLQLYIPSLFEITFMKSKGITDTNLQVNFLALLKVYQRLGYFIKVKNIADAILNKVFDALNIEDKAVLKLGYKNKETLSRHRSYIRDFLDTMPFKHSTEQLVEEVSLEAAQTMNDLADIINTALDRLISLRYELPN